MKRISLVVLAVMTATLASCGRDGPGSTIVSPTPFSDLGPMRTEEGVPGPMFARARTSDQVNPVIHPGQEVFITDDGPVPQKLHAIVNAEIWFVNETDEVRRVEFTNYDWSSDRIEPGEHASFTPDSGGTFAFRIAGDDEARGSIEIGPYYEAGETAPPEVAE